MGFLEDLEKMQATPPREVRVEVVDQQIKAVMINLRLNETCPASWEDTFLSMTYIKAALDEAQTLDEVRQLLS